MKQQRTKKYTCLVYGEGRKDKKFLIALIDLEKFKYYTQKWASFQYGNASGGSPKDILEQCKKSLSGRSYDLVLCFIDLDKLKEDFPKNWESKKLKLENNYKEYEIEIIWQQDKLEDEFKRVIGHNEAGKKEINKLAKEGIERFINSGFWKRILKSIKEREEVIESRNDD